MVLSPGSLPGQAQQFKTKVMYKRLTKDVFILRWKGEDIDNEDTLQGARYLQKEYNMAYQGGVTIIKRRETL